MRISSCPETAELQLFDEVAVDLQEFSGEGFALEEVGDLRLDALVAADDGGDGGGGCDGDEERVANAGGCDALARVRSNA